MSRLWVPGIRSCSIGMLLWAASIGLAGMAGVGIALAAEGLEGLRATSLKGLEARSAALVMSGQEGGTLPISLLTVALPAATGDGGRGRVAVVIDIDGDSLLGRSEEGAEEATFSAEVSAGQEGVLLAADPRTATILTEVHAYALAEDGGLTAYFNQAFVLERATVEARRDWGGVKFLGSLELGPGRYSLRVLVRQRDSGELALRVRDFEMPGAREPAEGANSEVPNSEVPATLPADGSTLTTGPLFAEPTDRWTLVYQDRGGAGPKTGIFPVESAGEAWVPATRPVVATGATHFFYLLDWGASEGVPETLAATLTPASGGPAVEVPVVVERLAGGLGEIAGETSRLLRAEFPGDLVAPGEYRFRVSSEAAAQPALPLAVVPPTLLAAQKPIWPDLLSQAGQGIPDARSEGILLEATEAASGRVAGGELGRTQSAYLGALAHLVTGDRRAALTAVAQLESDGFAEGTSEAVLLRGQLDAATEVSAKHRDNLLPLIQLHEELYLENRRADRFRLAAHSRRMSHLLVDLYAESSGGQETGTVAAGALVSLAGTLLRSGNSLEGMAVLEAALDYDPKHPTALLALASGYEILSEYRKAADLLRRYLEVRPASAEGKLRLGVNLKRVGAEKAAQALLVEAAAARDTPWVAILAAQELASALTGEGHWPEAVARLDEAIERFPSAQRLYLQKAAVLNAGGRRMEARGTLEALDRLLAQGAGREADSPRLRYSQWPERELEETRRGFIVHASTRLPGLVEVLSQLAAEGG